MPKDPSVRWMHVLEMDSSDPGLNICRTGDVLGRKLAAEVGLFVNLMSTVQTLPDFRT